MIKVACIGAGYFSQFHLDGWRRIDGATLVGVSDHNPAKAQATGAPVFDDLTQMLQQARPDILDIIVPPAGHADAIRLGLKHRVKAIICQKPFCTSRKQAEEMTHLAASASIPLIVHENFRFQPWYRAIAAQIESGAIGQPLQATFRLRPGDGQGPEAYLARQPYFQTMPRFLVHETAVHWVDTFRYLFGDPVAVYADLRRVNDAVAGEDAGYLIMDHPNGMRALFDGNRSLDHKAANPRCTMGEGLFEGTAGSLQLSGDGSVQLRRFGEQVSSEVLAPDNSGNFGGDCAYRLQSHVVASLKTGQPYENTAQDYLTVMRAEDAIYQSAAQGRKLTLVPS